jgi:hypothetical protein
MVVIDTLELFRQIEQRRKDRTQTYPHLSRSATIAPRDSKEDSIVLGKHVGGDDGVVTLGWSVHLAQDLFRQCLGHLKDIAFCTGLQDALFDAFAHGGHMTVHGIVNDGNLCHDFKLQLQ